MNNSNNTRSTTAPTVAFYQHLLKVGRDHEALGNEAETQEYYTGMLQYLRARRLPMVLRSLESARAEHSHAMRNNHDEAAGSVPPTMEERLRSMQVQVALTRELIATFEAILQQRQSVQELTGSMHGLLHRPTANPAATAATNNDASDASDDEDVLMMRTSE